MIIKIEDRIERISPTLLLTIFFPLVEISPTTEIVNPIPILIIIAEIIPTYI